MTAGVVMARVLLTLCFIGSIIWSSFFLLIALLMGSGLADEPGDTNGARRFATFFAVFVLPGVIAAVIAGRAMRAHDRATHGTAAGFPIEPRESISRRCPDNADTDELQPPEGT